MIKIKNKNKFTTFLCACLLAVGSLFGLVGAVGNTLAYTPSKFTTIDLDFAISKINSNYDLKNYFDGYFTYNYNSSPSSFNLYGFTSLPNISYLYFENDGGVHFDIVYNTPLSNGRPVVTANTSSYFSDISNIELIEYATQGNYILFNGYFGGLNGIQANLVNVALNKLISFNSVITLDINGNYYNFCSMYMLKQNESYLSAFNSDGYEEGYNQGLIEGADVVLNNPNEYGLYTENDLNNSYSNGYNDGVGYALYGVLDDINFTVVRTQGNETLSNALEKYLNGYVLNSNYWGNVGSVTSSYLNFNIQFNKPFVYTEQLNFTFSTVPQYYLEYTLIDTDNNSYRYYFQKSTDDLNSDNPTVRIINEPLKDSNGQFITGPVLPNKLIKSLTFSIKDNYYDKAELFLHQISDDYNLGYDVGYENGFINGSTSVDTQQYYNNGYSQGLIVGKDVGYYEGLANAENATFYSMISSVIDVPINSLRNLFNVEILGVNLFGFFTGLFTLCVIITLIRLFLGGK